MRLIKRAEFGWGSSGAAYAKPTRGLVIHYDGAVCPQISVRAETMN